MRRATWFPLPALPPGGLHHDTGGAPESTARGPSLALALEAAQTAIETCSGKGFRIGVSVIDAVGEARAMITADGADGSHVFVGMRKALTALALEMPSAKVADLVANDKALLSRLKPNMFVMGGALPIVVNHHTIGAIGVSGAAGMPFRPPGRTVRGRRIDQNPEQTQVGEAYARVAKTAIGAMRILCKFRRVRICSIKWASSSTI